MEMRRKWYRETNWQKNRDEIREWTQNLEINANGPWRASSKRPTVAEMSLSHGRRASGGSDKG